MSGLLGHRGLLLLRKKNNQLIVGQVTAADGKFASLYSGTGELLNRITAAGPFLESKFSPDGTEVVLGGASGAQVQVLKLSDNSIRQPSVMVPISQVQDIAWSKTGEYFAVCNPHTPFVRVYKTSDLSARQLGTLPANGNGVEYSPDNTKLAVAGTTLAIYNADTLALINTVAGIIGPKKARWSPDGSMLAVLANDTGYMAVFLTSDWSKINNASIAIGSTFKDLAWSPDGTKLVAVETGTVGIHVWNTSTWEKTTIASANVNHQDIAMDPAGDKFSVVATGSNPDVRTYSLSTLTLIGQSPSNASNSAYCAAYRPS